MPARPVSAAERESLAIGAWILGTGGGGRPYLALHAPALRRGPGRVGWIRPTIAQVSGEVDQIFQNLSRDAAIANARRLAEDRAVRAGTDRASLSVVEVEDLPIAYLPGNALRARVRVVGEVADRPR
jgi:hypothetical protein